MISFLNYSCPRDYKILHYSIDSVKRIMAGQNYNIHCFLDNKDGINIGPIIDKVNLYKVNFNLGGNLNGIDFIVNHIKILKMLARESDYIVKMDSDILMFNKKFIDILNAGQFDLLGKYGHLTKKDMEFCYGCCYIISANIVNKLPDNKNDIIDLLLTRKDWFPPGIMYKWAEDQAMSYLVNHFDGNIYLESPSYTTGTLGLWRYDLSGQKVSEYLLSSCVCFFDFIEFGRKKKISWAEGKDNKNKEREKTIKTVVELINNHNYQYWAEICGNNLNNYVE